MSSSLARSEAVWWSNKVRSCVVAEHGADLSVCVTIGEAIVQRRGDSTKGE